VTRQSRRKRGLRRVRRWLASAMAALVATFPSLEPLAIRFGRAAAKRSRLFAGLYWFAQESLIARLRRQGERFRPVHVLGRRLQLDITDPTGRMPYFYRTPYEKGVTDAIVTALKPGDVFIDVGANIGYFSVLAAQVVGPSGRVVAFEPHDGARDMLETVVQRNEAAARVDVVALALADADGSATLFVEDAITAHSTIEPELSPMRHVAALRQASTVHVTTLDGWLASHPGLAARVRCIKIDVEGAEARVLAGMRQMLQARSLRIVCETTIGTAADRALVAAGFERRRIESGTSPYGNFLYVRP
jgi:FkbM family methyltransferase